MERYTAPALLIALHSLDRHAEQTGQRLLRFTELFAIVGKFLGSHETLTD